MDLLTVYVLASLGGLLSVFSPCSLLLFPSLALNKPLARNHLPFFAVGIAIGTLLFVLVSFFLKSFVSTNLLPILGISLLLLGCFQVFQAYRNRNCSICRTSTKNVSIVFLGFIASGFYGCMLAPVAGILAYSISEHSTLISVLLASLAYVVGRIVCFVALLLLPTNFYLKKIVAKTGEKILELSSGLIMMPLGIYLIFL